MTQLAEFAEAHSGLLPGNVGSPRLLARLREEAPRFAQYEHTVSHQLAADTDYVALCHWNANIDNAWFWRDAGDVLHCGLLDWGCVGQMNMGMAIWGAMSGAETDLWNCHSTNYRSCSSRKSIDSAARIWTNAVRCRHTHQSSGTTKASARRCRCCPTC